MDAHQLLEKCYPLVGLPGSYREQQAGQPLVPLIAYAEEWTYQRDDLGLGCFQVRSEVWKNLGVQYGIVLREQVSHWHTLKTRQPAWVSRNRLQKTGPLRRVYEIAVRDYPFLLTWIGKAPEPAQHVVAQMESQGRRGKQAV